MMGDVDRILGALNEAKEEHGRQLVAVFDAIGDTNKTVACVDRKVAVLQADVDTMKHDGCARGEEHREVIQSNALEIEALKTISSRTVRGAGFSSAGGVTGILVLWRITHWLAARLGEHDWTEAWQILMQ